MILVNDWRLAVRMLFRQPGLAAAAVVALALGVGLTTLLFSIGYGIFLRGLPLPDGRRVMAVTFTNVATARQRLPVGIHDLAEWRAAQRSFDDLAAFQFASLNIVVRDGQPERLRGAFLTANGMELLRVRPLLGRMLMAADGAPGAARALVLGYGAWTAYFGSDPHVVGRAVRADGEPATIVGVMPRNFGFPESQEAWMVLRADPLKVPRGTGPSLTVYGRLKPGTSPASAQADLRTIAARAARQHPETNRNLAPVVQLYTEAMGSDEEGMLFMLLTLGLGFGVLLVACANVANLLLARAAARTREIAVRTALGAGRRRLVAQLLAESAVLAIAGSAVGLLLARAGIWQFAQAIADKNPPFWVKVELDPASLAFAAGLAALSALLSGAIPAWRASSAHVNELLKDSARAGGGLRLGRLSRVLVTGEIVVSFGLLVAAGLMVRSILNLGTHQYGFAMEDVFTARLVLPEGRYGDAGSRARFTAAFQDRVAALTAVRSATLASALPGLPADRTAVALDGPGYEDSSRYPVVRSAAIAPRFFETFDRKVLAGRDFTPGDDDGAPRVAIVNASFATQLMRGTDPVGRRIRLGRDAGARWLTVVGVAPDLYMGGAENRDPAGVYVPLAQSTPRGLSVAARVPGDPLALAAALRAQAAAIDPDLPIYAPNTLRRAVDDSMWAYRVFGPLLVIVGPAALFLATIGLYSLMAFAMRQRIREIGLRIALGAQPAHVARLVAGQVSAEVGIGLLAGGALAAGVARAIQAMLFHVQPDDPFTYVAIVLALVAAATTAAWFPVRRAIRVDPSVTLRDA